MTETAYTRFDLCRREKANIHNEILRGGPECGLKFAQTMWDCATGVPDDENEKKYYLFNYGITRPSYRRFHIDDETFFKAEVIDTWNMTIADAGTHKSRFKIDLPGQKYMALRLINASVAPL